MTITTTTSTTSTPAASTAAPSMAGSNNNINTSTGVSSNGASNINGQAAATADGQEATVPSGIIDSNSSSSTLNNSITNDRTIENNTGGPMSPPIPSPPKKEAPVPISLVPAEVKCMSSIDEATSHGKTSGTSVNGDLGAKCTDGGISSHHLTNTSNEASDAPPVKKLKGLLKKPSPDKKSRNNGDRSHNKRVTFSETMMVFCDDWPMEYMPQIMAMKSPSDFNLVEVAASGYMFEPPIEYQDCLPFDPPPDYRDVIAQVTRANDPNGDDDEQGSGHLQHSYVTHNESVVNTANVVTTTAASTAAVATLKSATSTSATSAIVIPATDDVSNGFAFIDSGELKSKMCFTSEREREREKDRERERTIYKIQCEKQVQKSSLSYFFFPSSLFHIEKGGMKE